MPGTSYPPVPTVILARPGQARSGLNRLIAARLGPSQARADPGRTRSGGPRAGGASRCGCCVRTQGLHAAAGPWSGARGARGG